MSSSVIIGLIGGTGLDRDSSLMANKKLVDLQETPYGKASDSQVVSGLIEGVPVYILARHGMNHSVNPSEVNYRANLWALVEQLKCTHILVTSACGSLREEIEPGHVGILDQYIDRTVSYRGRSFYKVCHVAQGKPIDPTMQTYIAEACGEFDDIKCHPNLTAVTIEGPRYSTLAESRLHQSWGCHVVNMTTVPEVQLASELGVFYACILLITDYDCWRPDVESVTADLVVERMKQLSATVRKVIPKIIRRIGEKDWSSESKISQQKVKDSIMFI